MEIKPSTREGKKYMAIFSNPKKTIHFGAKGMDDYTLTHDKEQQEKYLKRHAREDWNNPRTAGALSRWILWNTTSLNNNIKLFKQKFKL